MHILNIFIIAIALAMDAFAVSITEGNVNKPLKKSNALTIATFFGIFQAGMPLIGWVLGSVIIKYIDRYDHWVVFGILSIIGTKMIYESFRINKAKKISNLRLKRLLILSIATSIDALAIGFSIALLHINIFLAILIIGMVTFLLSIIGVYIGYFLGHFFENKIEFLGGIILIGIGVKILLEHLM